MMVKISVILPVFNNEMYIKQAVESVLAQTFTDFELIVVNDGSTDSTQDIINSFTDDRIIALEVAYAEITRFDADLTFFKMINYDGEKYYGNDWFEMKTFDSSFEDRAFSPKETPGSIFDLSVGVCQKIYNKKFLKKINARFPEGIFFEDMPFFYYVYLKAEKISIIKRHLYVRRKHTQSITNVVDEKFFDTVPAGQELLRIFIENGWYDAYKFDLLAYKINGPRFALRDMPPECRPHMFDLIKSDYESIKRTQYYEDFLTQLGPVKKKFFLDVLKSDDYGEFSRKAR